jgi:AcrR family transcriptional regulator
MLARTVRSPQGAHMPQPDNVDVVVADGTTVAPAVEPTRQRLIDATIELFIEGGYEATKVQKIARRAGMTTGAIYANFTSKEELLAEAIGQASLLALQTELSPAIEGLSSVEILQFLASEALGAPATGNHGMIIQGLAAAVRNPELRDTVIAPIRRLSDSVKLLLADAQRRGDLDADLDLDAVAYFAMTMTFGAFALKALNWELPDRATLDEVAARLLAGFGSPPASR